MTKIILPENSEIRTLFGKIVKSKRFVFVAGIPGVGKSLYVQQLALMAQATGRTVHLFQYDVARMAFENSEIGREKYPEINGFTQPAMRKAVGMWAREAIWDWHHRYRDSQNILIGELPLVGNRLIEIVQKEVDPAEPLLAGESAQYLVPVPSKRIRAKIEAARIASIANPRNAKEVKDAELQVLKDNWEKTFKLAFKLGLVANIPSCSEAEYEPAAYAGVFEHLLQHRPSQTLHIDLDLKPSGSVYDLENIASEPKASAAEVKRIIEQMERTMTPAMIEESVADWYKL
ncbi:MAG: hypothetical protein ACI9EW_002542 [Cellvibrionaceae bacterium]|jgi:hypothetical protein